MKRNKRNRDKILEHLMRVRDVLYTTDISACYWSNIVEENQIGILFDGDPRGNGTKPFVLVEFYQNYVKFRSGRDLTKAEKQNKIRYKDFASDEDFAKHLIRLVNEYFDDWALVRKSSLAAK